MSGVAASVERDTDRKGMYTLVTILFCQQTIIDRHRHNRAICKALFSLIPALTFELG